MIQILILWILAYYFESIPVTILGLGLLATMGNHRMIAMAFIIGFTSDLIINISSSMGTGARSTALQEYFTHQGTFPAAMFAAMLTAFMVIHTHILSTILGVSNTPGLLLLAFVVGATWGLVGQESRAMAPLYPFYQSTSGCIENRLWDGMSLVIAYWIIMYKNPS